MLCGNQLFSIWFPSEVFGDLSPLGVKKSLIMQFQKICICDLLDSLRVGLSSGILDVTFDLNKENKLVETLFEIHNE